MEKLNKRLIFITLSRISSLEENSIYSDLLKCFFENGYDITIVSPLERRLKIATRIREIKKITYLDVKTFNIQKTNFFEKGIGTFWIPYSYIHAIKKHLKFKTYDLVLYSTPPITFYSVIKFLKKTYNAYCYLLLKDIFPQNAVDIDLIKKNSILYKYFRKQEIKLYKISDFIGCMSFENVEYILRKNKFIKRNKIEINPNSIFIPPPINFKNFEKDQTLKLIYGGNLGKPQGIEYLINAIKACSDLTNVEFVIAGNGTEDFLVKEWIRKENPKNVSYFDMLPQIEYEKMIENAHVGIVCLDKRFTIPNYPSRLLSYMKFGMPVICLTDTNTDIGKDAMKNGYGYWCLSDDYNAFRNFVIHFKDNPLAIKQMSERAFVHLNEDFNVEISFNKIHEKLINI